MENNFNDFRFAGLNYRSHSNKYFTMDRVSNDENKIVVKVADCHLIETRFGYALILDYNHVVFLKPWQVDRNFYGNEVLIDRKYWKVSEWGEHREFGENPDNYDFNNWLKVAKEQDNMYDEEEGCRINKVEWKK